MSRADPDVYAAIIEVYGLVTQSPPGDTWLKGDRPWDETGIEDAIQGPWIAHPDARLDHPAQDYHIALSTGFTSVKTPTKTCLRSTSPTICRCQRLIGSKCLTIRTR